MKLTNERRNMYALINNMIMEKLQKGKMPWGQTWNNFNPARKYVSDKAYMGHGITAKGLGCTDRHYGFAFPKSLNRNEDMAQGFR